MNSFLRLAVPHPSPPRTGVLVKCLKVPARGRRRWSLRDTPDGVHERRFPPCGGLLGGGDSAGREEREARASSGEPSYTP